MFEVVKCSEKLEKKKIKFRKKGALKINRNFTSIGFEPEWTRVNFEIF